MDMFGIGSAVRAILSHYCMGARATGRSTMLARAVRPGDRVVFLDMKDARPFQRLVQTHNSEAHGKVVCMVTSPGGLWANGEHVERIPGRTFFDHRWLEAYYTQIIEQAIAEIDDLTAQLSLEESVPNYSSTLNLAKWN